ncbi:MAG: hypothetical protein AAGE98_17485 [Actinomycetota bacterium]
MRLLLTIHHKLDRHSGAPGVTLAQAQDASAFELTVLGDVPESRMPTDEELHLIRDVFDPNGVRNGEFR